MEKKICYLTKKQKEKFSFYVEKWLKIGLCTDEIDPKKAKKAIKKCYRLVGLSEPIKIFGPYDCPLSSLDAECRLLKENGVKSFSPIEVLNGCVYGFSDASWLSFYDFFKTECSLPLDILEGLIEVSLNCGWWTPYRDFAFFQHRPIAINLINGVLHCEDGPAIKYRGGKTEVYCLNGIRMDKKYVMTPAEKMNPKLILSEKNVEIRRELIKKVGIERMLGELKYKVLDRVGDYELLSVELSDEVPDARYLKMNNPSIGVFHVEGVEGKTVQEALNFRASNISFGGDWSPSVLT